MEKIEEILKLNNEVIRMLTSTINSIRAKQEAKSVREDEADYITDVHDD